MAECLHVINKRVLQLTNESSVQGGGFKYKEEEKPWSASPNLQEISTSYTTRF
jgi:hypothetical protein